MEKMEKIEKEQLAGWLLLLLLVLLLLLGTWTRPRTDYHRDRIIPTTIAMV